MTTGARRRGEGRAATPAPSSPVSIDSAPHYVWGVACDGWRLLDHAGLSVIQERMPHGAHESWHRHARARQFFFVCSGCVTIDRGDGSTTLRAGEGLHVPPRVAHRVTSVSREGAVFLVISSPSNAGDRRDVEPPPPPRGRRRAPA